MVKFTSTCGLDCCTVCSTIHFVIFEGHSGLSYSFVNSKIGYFIGEDTFSVLEDTFIIRRKHGLIQQLLSTSGLPFSSLYKIVFLDLAFSICCSRPECICCLF